MKLKNKINKKVFKLLFLLNLIFLTQLKPARRLIDKIEARVDGENILKRYLKKPQISKNGQPYTLKEAELESAMLKKATLMQVLPKDTEVEAQIVALKKNNNLDDLSDKEFEEQLKAEGFTLEDYKSQLAKMMAIEKLKQAEFSEKIVVTNQEIENYYKKHPTYVEDEFLIKITEVPEKFINKKPEEIKTQFLKWDSLDWIKKKDLDQDLAFVCKMKKGEISKPVKRNNFYQIIKLEDKKDGHLKTLNESIIEIERILQEEKKVKFQKEFEDDILSKAKIKEL